MQPCMLQGERRFYQVFLIQVRLSRRSPRRPGWGTPRWPPGGAGGGGRDEDGSAGGRGLGGDTQEEVPRRRLPDGTSLGMHVWQEKET